jgi:hypothetical protein
MTVKDSFKVEIQKGFKYNDFFCIKFPFYRSIPCSRWAELSEAIRFHMNLARATATPTEFRFLNSAHPILVGKGNNIDESADFSIINSILSESPNGGTPLCRHIREVIASIQTLEPSLRAQGQRACVIIATDGESSDGDIAQAMLPLKDLPVWVVLRLCTDDDKVVSYWNAIDEQLELSMDVLDDLFGEAEEVYRCNPWLVYGEPLHRLREFGSLSRELDLLDERLVPLEDLRKICCLL